MQEDPKEKVDYWLSNFPMSPSVNESLRPSAWTSKISAKKSIPVSRLIHTKVAKSYLGSVDLFRAQHRVWLERLSNHLQRRISLGKTFDLTMYYYFANERVFTGSGVPKKLDTSNFSKLAVDGFCRCIGIDDSLFFRDSHVKLSVPRGTAVKGRDQKSNRWIVDKSKEFIVIHLKEFEINFDPITDIEKRIKEKK